MSPRKPVELFGGPHDGQCLTIEDWIDEYAIPEDGAPFSLDGVSYRESRYIRTGVKCTHGNNIFRWNGEV
jgi:hypothetical protein